VAQGFAEHFPVTQAGLDVMGRLFPRSGDEASCFPGLRQRNCGGRRCLFRRVEEFAAFSALARCRRFRRRGVQTALMSARMAWATERGLRLGR